MNLRELDFPLRVYWDLNHGEHNKTIDCLRICEDILEIKVLSLSLYEAGFPLSPSCIKVLERLRNKNIAVSLTITNSALNTPTIELLIDLNVKTLFVDVSALDELISTLCPPLAKGGRGDFGGISFNINRNNFHEIPDVLSCCIKKKIKHLAFPMQRLINKCVAGMTPQKNLPLPLFAKEGNALLNLPLIEWNYPSLWQREDRRDFIIGSLHTYELLSINESDCFYINKKDREELALRVNKINHENIKLIIHDPFLWRVFYPSIDFPGGGCQAANSMIYISPDSAVYPCPSMPVKLGDLKTQRLKEIILSPQKKELRKGLGIPPDECIDCKELKQCMGGCRGRAYFLKGSLGYKDPAC